MDCRVTAFTDTYLPTVNGVTYTVKAWRDRFEANGGQMAVVYPRANGYVPAAGEHPVRSLPFPFYKGYRLGIPTLPNTVDDADIVHAHTPFGLGLAALRLVRRTQRPLVASFHTPSGEYTRYLSSYDPFSSRLRSVAHRYERWFLNHADTVIAPTGATADLLSEVMGVTAPIEIVPNGVDLTRFRPVDGAAFRERHGLPGRPLIGYTGRHGYEKRLHEAIDAVAAGPDDWTLVLGGEGPTTADLIARAESKGVDLITLGFLDREELPGFYSALDVFAFPSPVETQGLVALEAIACGTPVVGVDAGALAETIVPGESGYRYRQGDIDQFTQQLELALDEHRSLSRRCLTTREEISLERAIESLDDVYDSVLTAY